MIISNITPSNGSYKPGSEAKSLSAAKSDGKIKQRHPIAENTTERQPAALVDNAQYDNAHMALKEIGVRHNEQNRVAVKTRKADEKNRFIGQQIGRMKNELNTIIKNYPPFPPGSEERIAALKNFSAYRKELEQLTYPPNNDSDTIGSQGFSSSYVGTETGSLVVEPVEGNGYVYAVRRVSEGVQEIEIPVPLLSDDASDNAIHSALTDLEKSNDLVGRQRLYEEFDRLFPDKSTLSAEEAGEKSVSIRQTLAEYSDVNLSRMPSMLVGLMS